MDELGSTAIDMITDAYPNNFFFKKKGREHCRILRRKMQSCGKGSRRISLGYNDYYRVFSRL